MGVLWKKNYPPVRGFYSSSFLGLPYRILNTNPKKELLWSLWVVTTEPQKGTTMEPMGGDYIVARVWDLGFIV